MPILVDIVRSAGPSFQKRGANSRKQSTSFKLIYLLVSIPSAESATEHDRESTSNTLRAVDLELPPLVRLPQCLLQPLFEDSHHWRGRF